MAEMIENLTVDKPWLMLGDCLERMTEIPDGSVDMVLCDLPYGATRHGWDCQILLDPLWRHYSRLVKPTGAVVLTASQPFTTTLITSNRDWFRYSLVWEKDNATNFLNAKHQPLKVHEDVLVFSASASTYSPRGSMAYHPQKTPGKPYRTGQTKKALHNFHVRLTNQSVNRACVNNGDRYPRSVLKFNTERGLHPTQKPVALLEYLIRTYTNEGDTVLDNCAGSFSTGVACQNTGRRFIGIEQHEPYFDIGRRRIEAAIAAANQPAIPGGLFTAQDAAE
jgi:site-specific DNA-methyltransferase (adenine-specific)